jgi:hypothetical protein
MDFIFIKTVQQRRVLDRAGSATGSHHGWQADDQQCSGVSPTRLFSL